MVNQDIRLRFSSDQSNAIAGIGQLQGKMRSLASEASGDIQNKISSIFSVSVIEEAVRRTGEWATALSKAANEVGVTAEEYQALTRMFDKAGVGSEKIEQYFDKITEAIDKARQGTGKFKQALNQLGVTGNMNPTQAFGAAMNGARNNDAYTRNAIEEIFGGKNLLHVQALAREMGGETPSGYAAQHKEEMVSNEDISEMEQNWQTVIYDLKSMAAKLAPLMTVILAIIDGITKMANGIVGVTKFSLKTMWNGIGGGALFNRNPGEGIIDAYKRTNNQSSDEFQARFLSKGAAKNVGNAATLGFIKSLNNPYANTPNMTSAAKREMEGFANAATMVGTVGIGGIAKLAGMGVKGAGLTADIIAPGARGAGIGANAAKIGDAMDISDTGIGKGVIGSLSERYIKWRAKIIAAGGITKERYLKSLDPAAQKAGFKARDALSADESMDWASDLELQQALKDVQMQGYWDQIRKVAARRQSMTLSKAKPYIKGAGYAGQAAEAGIYGRYGNEDVTNRPAGDGWTGTPFSTNGLPAQGRGPNISIGGLMGVDNLASNIAQSIADNTKQTADNTSRMANAMERSAGDSVKAAFATSGQYLQYGGGF